jgi:hypothetical protein
LSNAKSVNAKIGGVQAWGKMAMKRTACPRGMFTSAR